MLVTIKCDRNTNQDAKEFVKIVWSILNHSRGWSQIIKFKKSGRDDKHVTIRLSKEETIRKKCGFRKLSCALGKSTIYLHLDNWLHGSKASGLSLTNYRKYLVNHEIGHILGLGHKKPVGTGKCPVMVQQTLGIGNQKPNVWPLMKELSAALRK